MTPCTTIHSLWNSPGQNTGVKERSLSLHQEIISTLPRRSGNEHRSPELQMDSLPAEPPGYNVAVDIIGIWIRFTYSCPVSLVAQMVKHLLAMWETQIWSLGQEDPLEKEMATHSSVFFLENSMDGGSWWAIVHSVTKSWTELSTFTSLLLSSLIHWFLRCLCSILPSLSW